MTPKKLNKIVDKNATIMVRIKPRMAKDEIYAVMNDGTYKIRLTAPPVNGKANAALIKFLSSVLHTPATSIQILSGFTSPNKCISISDISKDEADNRLREAIKPE